MECNQDGENTNFLSEEGQIVLEEGKSKKSNAKTFKCTYCQKFLSSKQNLKEHLFTHTGELPYVCRFSGCGIRFRQGSVLSSHKKIHHAIEKFVAEDRFLCLKVTLIQLSEHFREQKEIFDVRSNEDKITYVLLPPIEKVQEYFIKPSQPGI